MGPGGGGGGGGGGGQGKEVADSIGIDFLETAAKTASNVERAFSTMAAQVRVPLRIPPAPALDHHPPGGAD